MELNKVFIQTSYIKAIKQIRQNKNLMMLQATSGMLHEEKYNAAKFG